MEFIHDDDSDDIGDKRGRVNAALKGSIQILSPSLPLRI